MDSGARIGSASVAWETVVEKVEVDGVGDATGSTLAGERRCTVEGEGGGDVDMEQVGALPRVVSIRRACCSVVFKATVPPGAGESGGSAWSGR